jgi:hypothetical protein
MLGMFAVNPLGTNLTTVPTDRHPHNAVGVNIVAGPNGQPWVDQNFDGQQDVGNGFLLALNWSPAASVGVGTNLGFGGAPSRAQIFNNVFTNIGIDAGYTYPDINSPFLAYVATVPQNANGAAPIFVLIPSFHRPQYLRNPNTGAPMFGLPAFQNWYDNNSGTATDTTNHVFCPHPGHVVAGTTTPRFLTAPVVVSATHTIQPFNFAVDSNGNGTPGEMGMWGKLPPTSPLSLDYPVDNDNDGIFDGVWLDLNWPASTLQDGRIMVPLFSYLVVDLDSLINLNTAGNLTAFTQLVHPLTGSPLSIMGSNNTPISRSNLGVTPSEINPFWALVTEPRNASFLNPPNTVGNPSPALQQYRGFFNQGNNPGNFVVDRVEAANMDMLLLLWGRPTYSVTVVGAQETYTLNNLAVGLWGEATALLNGVQSGAPFDFPRPGQSNFDDNNDRNAGVLETEPLFLGGAVVPPFSHPLDLTGGGQWLSLGTGKGLLPKLAGIFPTTPQTWAPLLEYTGYQPQNNFNAQTTYGTMGVYQGITIAGTQPLSQNPYMLYGNAGLIGIDEAAEVVPDRRYQQSSDQLYGTEEIGATQLSQPDYLAGLGQSRLRTIAALNFELNQQAATIRQRFTTDSADRKQHSFTRSTKRPWEYGFDPNNPNNPGNDWDGTGGNQFPPRTFLASATNPPFTLAGQVPVNVNSINWVGGTNTFAKAEPIRMELAALIGAKLNNMQFNANGVAVINTSPYNLTTNPNASPVPLTSWQQQFRLNINRVLTTTDPSLAMGPTNPLRYRELTPHPQRGMTSQPISQILTSPAQYAYPSSTSQTSFSTPTTGVALQEYWARRDRQMLARDIYVMLYLFGGGLDSEDRNGNGVLDAGEDLNGNNVIDNINYATTPNTITGPDSTDTNVPGKLQLRQLYNDRQLREMAQFAVNLVDSLDRDDTITRFEYDLDLSDGWSLDDDPFTVDAGTTVRGEVFGVEAQQLAFSESLVIIDQKVKSYIAPFPPKDHPATLLDDSQVHDRYFTFLELQNVYGYAVPLGNQNWQIAYTNAGTVNPNDATQDVNILTLSDTFSPAGVAGGPTLGGGQTYTIGSRTYNAGAPNEDKGPGDPQPSVLMVDPNWNRNTQTPNFQQIAPASNNGPVNLNLDLVAKSGQNRFILTGGPLSVGGVGSSVSTGAFVDPGPDATSLSLPYTFIFILRRRMNLNRPTPLITSGTYANDSLDNPFIEVDRMTFTVQGPTPPDTSGQASSTTPNPGVFNLRDPLDPGFNGGNPDNVAPFDIQPKLQRLNSRERVQPLDGSEGTNPPTTLKYSIASFFANTLGNVNQASRTYVPQGFTLWQPHFDRDFASIGELLSVPLYGPWQVTQKLSVAPTNTLFVGQIAAEAGPTNAGANSPIRPFPAVQAPSATPTTYPLYEARLAQAKFFRPQHPANIGNPKPVGINAQYDNRWHRLLELVEIPTRENMQVENNLQSTYTWLYPTALQRVPGKMNLNGTRYGETLYALLDDPNMFDPFGYNADGSYNDRLETGTRNWWFEFIAGRDGTGTNAQPDLQTGLYLPGAPGTQPFRSYSMVERNPMSYTTLPAGTNPPSAFPGPNTADDTLLRTLTQLEPVDATPGRSLEQRRLFEARAEADEISQGGNNTVDPYTRNRILSKIAGNATNRSHVFAVWMTVGFFEGYRPDPTNPNLVQIGAEMTDQTRRRGFFVVDRSVLEDAWNQNTGTYDFRKFVQYRKTIQ